MHRRSLSLDAGLVAALAASVLSGAAVSAVPAVAAEPAGLCADVPAPAADSASGGSLALTSKQFAINQRIAQAAVRRAAAIEDWLADGIVDADICGGSLAVADFGPGVQITTTAIATGAVRAKPRPLVVARADADPGVAFEVSAAQLLIAQRISQAAVRRAAALERRFGGGLTGAEVRNGTIGQARLAAGLRLVAADPRTPAVAVAKAASPASDEGASGGSGKVDLSVRQMRINQKISQAAIRRLNVLRHRIERGLTGEQFRDGTLTGADIATGPASATPTTPPVTPGPIGPGPVTPPVPADAQFQNHWQFITAPGPVPASQIAPWNGIEVDGGLPNERLVALTSPTQGIAPYSVRFTVKDGDVAGNGNRSELRIGTKTTGPDFEGDDVYSSFAVWFPAELTPGNFLIFHQMHPPSGPPNVSLELDGPSSGTGPVELLAWRRGGNKASPNASEHQIQANVTRDVWHNFIYRVRWESDNTGLFQLWHRIPSQSPTWRLVAEELGVPTGFVHDYGQGNEFGRPYPKIGAYGDPDDPFTRSIIYGGAHLRASSFGSAAALFGG